MTSVGRGTRRPVPGGDAAAFVERALDTWGEPPRPPGRIRVHAPADRVRPHVPPRQATVAPDGADACVLTSAGGWTRQFLVWAALLDVDLSVLGPPELRAEARAVGERLARAGQEP